MTNAKTKMYRTDELEKTLRKRALDTAVAFEHVGKFDVYNSGYIQALRDLGVDWEYIETYTRVMNRVRKSYGSDPVIGRFN